MIKNIKKLYDEFTVGVLNPSSDWHDSDKVPPPDTQDVEKEKE
ncbi:hypothetical protein [Desulfitobacterium dehalogenans]|nr:hypothetical protein [Desulfitobacterium dehalogenans]